MIKNAKPQRRNWLLKYLFGRDNELSSQRAEILILVIPTVVAATISLIITTLFVITVLVIMGTAVSGDQLQRIPLLNLTLSIVGSALGVALEYLIFRLSDKFKSHTRERREE